MGRIMRGVLNALESDGPYCTSAELAEAVGASRESTRRAVRQLVQAGQVSLLDVGPGGLREWCLSEDHARLLHWRVKWAQLRG